MGHQAIHGVTNANHEAILMDRARKHRALLHNQPLKAEDVAIPADTRIDESELILDHLLRTYGVIAGDEQIEEIGHVCADEAALNATKPYLSISTDRQVIEIPYE